MITEKQKVKNKCFTTNVSDLTPASKRNHGTELMELASLFKTKGNPISYVPFGNGHINETYMLTDSAKERYILQKINQHVFHNPKAVMQNIIAVTKHIRSIAENSKETITFMEAKDGNNWILDAEEETWRMYEFVEGICLEQAETVEDFRESGVAFGRFQSLLADFPADTLIETIPRFHDTPNRYVAFLEAVKQDKIGRVGKAQEEISFAMKYESYANTFLDLQKAGKLPLRVTHNDTKLNNVLLDSNTRKTLCVIDLDTVMPGLSINDFGDSIRFGASTAAEDEQDLDKVQFSLKLYKAYAEGFLSQCGDRLTDCEIEYLRDGAKMMTLECGVRFLTDYLCGDVYFHIKRSEHNLDRCRTQFKLIERMEDVWDELIL